MTSSTQKEPIIINKKPFRIFLYTLAAILAVNFDALVDLVLHPDLPYFDQKHFIAGGMISLLIIILCALLESCIEKQATSSGGNDSFSPRLGPYVWFFAAFWTIIVAISLGWNIVRQKQEVMQVALNEARTIYEKDLIYYRWATGHEGVFVPISKNTQPNPYLEEIPDCRGTTSLGRNLTLVNPEYMIRQVYEMQSPYSAVRGHITSLDPIIRKIRPFHDPPNGPSGMDRLLKIDLPSV